VEENCLKLIEKYSDEQLANELLPSMSMVNVDIEKLYTKSDECIKNLMEANYFQTSSFLLNQLAQSDKLSRHLYQMARAGVITGIEKTVQGQDDLTQFLEKYISKDPQVVISPAFRWA
jgi:hypothetical protein